MGSWFGRLFEEAGLKVLVSDRDTPLTNREVARQAEVVIVAVPMEVFPEVVQEIGPEISPEKGLIDLCSLKAREVALMLEHTRGEVVGAHPLFGPYERGLSGQTVALCPGRGERWLSWFREFLEVRGARTVVLSPEEHDRIMSLVQVLNHFWLVVLGRTLAESGLPVDRVVALATPSFRRQLEILSRLALQDPELYTTIQFENPLGEETRRLFWQIARELSEVLARKERQTYLQTFKEVQALAREIGSLLGLSAPEEKEPQTGQNHQETEKLSPGHPAEK
ncbi:prephenate dehydrogenase/arogenate dehydrogenase family protein [Thermosulfurimonas marina]|nr:prephenate dehydrogenase/arogenate dehydrogenase family protein [Thermosulfurimonas marina]